MKRYYNLFIVLPILFLTACSNGAKKPKVMPREYYCDNNPTRPKYLGDCADGSGVAESVGNNSNGASEFTNGASEFIGAHLATFLVVALFIFLVILYYLYLRWVWKVAIRNQRSGVGFVWLGFLTPYIAWVILLILDKRKTEPNS